MKRLFLIVGLLVIGCSDFNPMASEDCGCDLDISSTLPCYNGSYELEYNQNLAQTYTMLNAIKDYYKKTGIKIGMKPAGGISTSKIALQYLVMLKETLGDKWMNKELSRFGASSLANDVLMQLKKQEMGIYQSSDYFSKD